MFLRDITFAIERFAAIMWRITWKRSVRDYLTRVLFMLLSLCASVSLAVGQVDHLLHQSLSVETKPLSLKEILDLIEEEVNVHFAYSPSLLAVGRKFRLVAKDQSVQEVLTPLLEDVGLGYRTTPRKVVLFRLKTALPKFDLKGYILDDLTGEHLIAAHIYDPETGVGTYTNEYGYYNLNLPSGAYDLSVSYVGYEDQKLNILLELSQHRSIRLKPHDALATVEVIAKYRGEEAIQKTQISSSTLTMEEVVATPSLGGEVDITRALTLMPGVATGIEGTAGIFVRGGTPDQNLIMLDGVPVYNASHAFGFLSVFNSDAIQKMELIKGGFPARYSGRLSSVLDIRMKEGNFEHFGLSGSVSPIATRIGVEGPLIKNKMSFMLTGRRTFLDLFLGRPKRRDFESGFTEDSFKYFFSDFNGKWNYRISDRDRIYLSFYGGEDVFELNSQSGWEGGKTALLSDNSDGINWGNLIGAFRWNHLFGSSVFSNLTLNYSRYRFGLLSGLQESKTIDDVTSSIFTKEVFYNSFVRDWSLKLDFNLAPSPNHFIRFGAKIATIDFLNGESGIQSQNGPTSTPIDTSFNAGSKPAANLGVYVEDDFSLSRRVSANVGMNASLCRVDERTYSSLEPRFVMRLLLHKHWAYRVAYSRMTQYLHLVSNSGIGLPNDLWISPTATIPPQRSWQLASGINYIAHGFDISLEAYHKKMMKLVAFQDANVNILSPLSIHEQVVIGHGKSTGLELLFKKQKGKTNAWISYTLAWTDRSFPDIDGGQPFPYKYDRRHDLSLTILQKLSSRFQLSASWVFQNGIAVSLPQQEFEIAQSISTEISPAFINLGYYALDYGTRNGFRFPFYHRLDLSLAYYMKANWGNHSLHLSVYNAYNRKNPISISPGLYSKDDGSLEFKYRSMSLIPILPGIAYRFNFSKL